MTVLYIISKNGLVISILVNLPTLVAFFLPPFIFVNFKLIAIVRKERSKREISCTRKNLKNISIALWVVVCLMLLYIPTSFYIAFNLAEKSTNTRIFSWIWALTCRTVNCASNSLIIFCKKTVLGTERIKYIVFSDLEQELYIHLLCLSSDLIIAYTSVEFKIQI